MQRLNTDTPDFLCLSQLGSLSWGSRPVGHMNHAGLALMLEPVALAADRHDVRVVQQPIERRRRQCRILCKRCIPLTERQIAGDDQAAFFIQRCDDLEEQVCLLPVHRQIADLITDEQKNGVRSFIIRNF